jgi:predicted nuclease of predicted toxin-antitoxin system
LTQPDPIVLFIDRSLGRHLIAERLREVGVQVEVHDDHFKIDAADQDWLEEVGRRGWIVLTKDKNFRYRQLETAAIARAAVRVFHLTAGNLRAEEMAEAFVKALPKVVAAVQANPAPFIAKITRSGKVLVVLNRRKLRRYTGPR